MKLCARYRDFIARYLHGGLLLHEKEELERHLSECASCEALYSNVAETDRILREMRDRQPEPSPFLRARILANLPGAAPARPGFGWVRWFAFAGGAAVCAVAALLAIEQGRLSPGKRVASSPVVSGKPSAPATAKARPAPQERVAKFEAPEGAARKREPSEKAPERVQIIREVKIYFYYPPAQKVAVTGDFNGWDPDGVSLEPGGKPGLWTTNLRLRPGAYSYNFIVDGEVLVPDPDAANQAPDGYGGTNSILLVKGDNPA